MPDCTDLCPNSPIESQVDADGCPLDVHLSSPSAQSRSSRPKVPESDTVDDGAVQITTVNDAVVDVPVGASTGATSQTCGAHGALGLIGWCGLLVGPFGLRAKSIGSA